MTLTQQNDYTALLKTAEQLPTSKLKRIYIPVSHYLQEVKQLLMWSATDKDLLLTCGLTENTINATAFLLQKAEEAHLEWTQIQSTLSEEATIWNKRKKEAKQFHRELMRSFKYAFRNDSALMHTLNAFENHSKAYPIIIQDFSDLAVLGEANIEPLKVTNFKIGLLDKARSDSKSLAIALANKNAITRDMNPIKNRRNQLLSLLKNHVDEIRRAGRFVFANTPERLKGYKSEYTKRKNNKYQAKIKNNH